MHVLFINARYRPEGVAGPAFTTQLLAEQLAAEGGQASVLCRSERTGMRQEVIAGVNVIRIGVDATASEVHALASPLLKRLRPNLIHTMFPREFSLPGLLDWARSHDLPIVHSLLAYFLLCPQGSLMRAGKRCLTQCDECRTATFAQRDFAAQVDAVVGISRHVLERHLQWGLFRDTPLRRVIHDGYQPPSAVTPRAQATLPLRLGFLGRIDPLKGVELLLRTLTTGLADRQWTLLVGGRGELRYVAELQRRYADPRIRFLGFVEPAQLLAQIDVLAAPSLFDEPFGRVLIEAYAHGVAVVGSRRGGMPEVIEEGTTGFTFDPDDGATLVAAISALLDDPLHLAAMKSRAMAKAAGEFSPQEILCQYRAVYDAVLARRRQP